MNAQMYALSVAILVLTLPIAYGESGADPQSSNPGKRLPVRWTAAVDLTDLQSVEAALDRRVITSDGEPLVLRKDFGDADTLSVTTGREWIKALKDGYGAYTTADMISQNWFDFTVGTIMLLTNARPSVASYVGDFQFGTNALDDLPCTLHPRWNQYVELAIEDGRVFPDLPTDWNEIADRSDFVGCGNSCPRYAEVFPDAVVGEHSPEQVELLVGNEDAGVQTILKLVAWGDFDGDGIEDLLMQQSTYYRGGSGRIYDHIVLTRLAPTGALVERPAPSMFGNAGP